MSTQAIKSKAQEERNLAESLGFVCNADSRRGFDYCRFEYNSLTCERCGCNLVSVDSTVTGKWHECIRHLNRPWLCEGTEEHSADQPLISKWVVWRASGVDAGFQAARCHHDGVSCAYCDHLSDAVGKFVPLEIALKYAKACAEGDKAKSESILNKLRKGKLA